MLSQDLREDTGCLRFFHVCTDGKGNGIIHLNETDYKNATIISAVSAIKSNVRIICHCHMSSHSHFVVYCYSPEDAHKFAESYKRDYSRYLFIEHNFNCSMRGIEVNIKEINDKYYLLNCISYVLNNPVAAKICRYPEEYPWSSFKAYFNRGPIVGQPVSGLKDCERRRILRTRVNLSSSGLRIDENGFLVLESFIDHRFVERIYGSQSNFYRSLALTDSNKEEEIYIPEKVRYNDNEILAEALAMSETKFGIRKLSSLTHRQKIWLVGRLVRRTGAREARIARALRVALPTRSPSNENEG